MAKIKYGPFEFKTTPISRQSGYRGNKADWERAKKTILSSQTNCGICGNPVDKSLKWPNPLSATVDHIIPVIKGGHPTDLHNLQLAHWCCNRQKSDKLQQQIREARPEEPEENEVNNRDLPLSTDWTAYKAT